MLMNSTPACRALFPALALNVGILRIQPGTLVWSALTASVRRAADA